ncbi:lipopolysaccharide biosynthesis glycosyltransferase [Shimia abyssi]|uniref:Lipopolysaccharide biosynthesis glycosyltransferase n=2 Tax=Shimia abyssi TaxID=1662395 RepID=A0A2P8F7A8_9RHOB|nr:lipopolysaccharide biosynthesis glycosyltransferase [Shimia abyssi]
MIGDDTGTNISSRNEAFNELTALYWAWKNDETSDFLGLLHYRRLLDLTEQPQKGDVERRPNEFFVADWIEHTENWLKANGSDWDIVVPRLHRMGRTVEQNFLARHSDREWRTLSDIIKKDHSEYSISFQLVGKSPDLRIGNLSLMHRSFFDRYCTWLFDILFKLEAAQLPRNNYNINQARYLGHVAERLLTVFIFHEQQNNPSLRLKEVSILNIGDTLVVPYIDRRDQLASEDVNIVCTADRAYLPHAAAMMRSVLDHADPARPINFFFLHSSINSSELNVLRSMVERRLATKFVPINTGRIFKGSYRSISRHASNTTYNKLLLFALFPGLRRILYLDTDLIVLKDICSLYDTDISGAKIAAVPDWIMTRTLTGLTETIDPAVPDLGVYQRDVLGLNEEQIARYFNAGVLLFNFEESSEIERTGKILMGLAKQNRYLFRDQDILNAHFSNNYYSLDPRWNVFNAPQASYGRVPKNLHSRAMQARKDPWIIHFADRDNKPWQSKPVGDAEHYWQALSRTPFFVEVLHRATKPDTRWGSNLQRAVITTGKRLAEKVPTLKSPLLKIYYWSKWRS